MHLESLLGLYGRSSVCVCGRTHTHIYLPKGSGWSAVFKPVSSGSPLLSGSEGFSLFGFKCSKLSALGWLWSEGSLLFSSPCTDVAQFWSVNNIFALVSISNQCKENPWATMLEKSTTIKRQECLLFPPRGVPVWCLAFSLFIFVMYCCLICLANLAGLSHGMLNISGSVPYITLQDCRVPSSSTSESFRLSKVNTLKARSTSFQLKASVRQRDLCC